MRPDEAVSHLRDRDKPVCYVLESSSVTDLAVLQDACVKLKLPRPQKRLLRRVEGPALVFLSEPAARFLGRAPRPASAPAAATNDCGRWPPIRSSMSSWCPVAMYWGRAPQRERSWFRLLFVEDWAITSRRAQVHAGALQRAQYMIEFDEPISLRASAGR